MTHTYTQESSYWRDRKNKELKKKQEHTTDEWAFYFLYGKFPTKNEFKQYIKNRNNFVFDTAYKNKDNK